MGIKLTAGLAALGLAITSQATRADDPLVGKDLQTGPAGQPFCTKREQLAEYLFAIVSKDQRRLEVLDSCITLKAGLRVHVLRDYEGSDIGHVVKARVSGRYGSMVAYTLSIGLEE